MEKKPTAKEPANEYDNSNNDHLKKRDIDYTATELVKKINKYKEGRIIETQKKLNKELANYFQIFSTRVDEISSVKDKLSYTVICMQTNSRNQQTAEITGNKFDISLFQNIHEKILQPERVKLENAIFKMSAVSPNVKEDKDKSTKKNPLTDKSVIVINNNKFRWSNIQKVDELVALLLKLKLIDNLYKDSFTKFLMNEKMEAQINWNGNKNVLTSLFFMLLFNRKLQSSKEFIAKAISNKFHFPMDTKSTDASVTSILEDLKPNNITRRINKGSKYYEPFNLLCST